ncbi:MAG: hypothetical protein GX793_09170 [Bacteroidales bacterium]|jgi:hypothetical protein|nr:hypothetical protein [Bacteroidales bacterium]MCK9499452.1 hypothetical protein [Bacteroidales bacterium]MDY0315419.1 hypothetical protein [Bacteroidales bacterium]NLB87216.1 hypothetical protein [Bacteroidales bacterium]
MKENKYLNILALINNYLFHPLTIITYTVIIFLNSEHYIGFMNANVKFSISLIFAITTLILPALFIPVLYFFGLISSTKGQNKNDRLLPVFIIIIMYFFAWYFMKRVSMPIILLNLVLSGTICLIIAGIISSFWKISFNTTGFGALLGFITYFSLSLNLNVLKFLFFTVFFAGLTGSSILYLNKNNPAQVYFGYILGFATVLTSMYIL